MVTVATKATIEWVVFDLGEVVLARTTRLPDLAALLGTGEAELATAYLRPSTRPGPRLRPRGLLGDDRR